MDPSIRARKYGEVLAPRMVQSARAFIAPIAVKVRFVRSGKSVGRDGSAISFATVCEGEKSFIQLIPSYASDHTSCAHTSIAKLGTPLSLQMMVSIAQVRS